METSLCKELGEASQLRGGTHVPSEKDLKQYLNRVEGLEQDRVGQSPSLLGMDLTSLLHLSHSGKEAEEIS